MAFRDDIRSKDTAQPFPFVGHVADREDPKQLGRVRVTIPSVAEPTPWAWPVGTGGGGSKDRGLFSVPAVGAEVVVWFVQGSLDFPIYLAAYWGKPKNAEGVPESEVPEEAQRTPPDNHVLSTESFRVELDETDGAKVCRISSVESGDMVEIDAEEHTMTIKATSRLQIIADGQVEIDGIEVTIKGRTVRAIPEPI